MFLDDHSHCDTCVQAKCKEGCPMVDCSIGCGLQLHWCKTEDHGLVCPEARVPCINQHNGCPRLMSRKDLGTHLRTCPASVVCCTREWNRWPLVSRERSHSVPFQHTNTHAKYGQLDVALALRDQKLLAEARSAPAHTRKVLRDSLNQHFPAVPLVFPHCNTAMAQDEEQGFGSSHFEVITEDLTLVEEIEKSSKPGLQASICNELFQAKKITTNSLSAALKLITKDSLPVPADVESSQSIGCDSESKGHICCDTNMIKETEQESPADKKITGCDQDTKMSDTEATKSDDKTNDSSTEDQSSKKDIPAPPGSPPMSLSPHQILALDMNFESISRYQAKPSAMYTFICGQVFRRDEYPWHVQNIHSEIQSSLNGWIEQRCPLATYGCNFSVRRMHPNSEGSAIVYSPILETFGVQPAYSKETSSESNHQMNTEVKSHDAAMVPDRQESHDSTDSEVRGVGVLKRLTDLPVEVLQHIVCFLDGFSLNHLALTSKLLRDVCLNVVEEKGVVLQQWQKQTRDGRPHWFIRETLWKFTPAVSPIRSWGFVDQVCMGHHLSQCPYLYGEKRLRHDQPFAIVPKTCIPTLTEQKDIFLKIYYIRQEESKYIGFPGPVYIPSGYFI